uniref:Glycosyltransferase 61 catalytic domain-containing protein n=1 Tax=Kwoniella bestiolae CBS 10118 TaxID=1296100 RepID=A0A1B9GE82_9TREE|nr:hypothetical protein I302_00865 [Kwoniella bestiolae CBS 10118]OCF29363.1 hypothetical protein I302_00865 [Kwoniella bestiolae CBS 10118]
MSTDYEANRPTKLTGGVSGFYVFEQLWYRNGTFYAFQDNTTIDTQPFPDRDTIMSGPHDTVLLPITTQQELFRELDGEIRFLKGQTLFLNDGADQWNWSYLSWFHHFAAEVLLGGITALSLARSVEDAKSIPRLMIPWEGNWKDGYGINEVMVSGMFGKDLVEKDQWDRWSEKGDWVGFEKVVIVDRYASHRHNPIANEWNKMALPIFSELPAPPPPFFTPYREALLHNLGLAIPPTRQQYGKSLNKIPKIVYLDRQDTNRKLTEGDHKGLLDVLKGLEKERKAVVGVPHLAEMDCRYQVKAVKDADVIIGVHGNGLTHQMWMSEGGVVIEVSLHLFALA